MGLFYIFLSSVNEGENILVPEPSYPFYHKLAPSLKAETIGYNLLEDKNWEIDLEDLKKKVNEKTKFLWVVNPSNPCGSIWSEKHMREILDFCLAHNLFLVSDEIYWNESFEKGVFKSFGHIEHEVPVVVIGGLEKTFLVPGWGCAWTIFFDKNQRL